MPFKYMWSFVWAIIKTGMYRQGNANDVDVHVHMSALKVYDLFSRKEVQVTNKNCIAVIEGQQ